MYLLPQYCGDEILVYLRKSRTDDPLMTVEEILERHEQRIREWIGRNLPEAGEIPEENFFREVGSGETIESRPRMQALLRAIESPKKKAIICVEPSRLSRGDLEDIGYLVKVLRYTNTIVITMDYVYDLNDERDREQLQRELMRGNDYLEYAKKVMQAGVLQSVRAGNFIARIPPYGYKKTSFKENGRTCHSLEPIPEEVEVVNRIFKLYRDGLGSCAICDLLTDEHIPAPSGGRRWAPSSVRTILQNEHYIGKVVWLKKRQTRTVEDGEIITKRKLTEDKIVADGKHPPIVSMELWDAAQETRGKKPRTPKSKELSNALAGLMFCKSCGASMVARTQKRGSRGVKGWSASFLCSVRRDGCTCGSTPQEPVYDEIIRVLEAAIEDFEIQIETGTDNGLELHLQKIARLEKRLTTLREKEVKQWEEKIEKGMPEHVFKMLNDATVAEIEEVQQALYEARETTPEEVDLEARVTTFRAALASIRDPEAPAKEKNRLLKACIERIDYYRARAAKLGGRRKGIDGRPITLEITLRV